MGTFHGLKGMFFAQLLIFAAILTPAAHASKAPSKMNVVVQINDGASEKVEGALRNVSHIMEAAHKANQQIKISVMIFGAALPMFKKANQSAPAVLAIQDLMKKEHDVDWHGCQNTLDRLGFQAADLIAGFQIVPSGALEVLKLQQAGYLYYRP